MEEWERSMVTSAYLGETSYLKCQSQYIVAVVWDFCLERVVRSRCTQELCLSLLTLAEAMYLQNTSYSYQKSKFIQNKLQTHEDLGNSVDFYSTAEHLS